LPDCENSSDRGTPSSTDFYLVAILGVCFNRPEYFHRFSAEVQYLVGQLAQNLPLAGANGYCDTSVDIQLSVAFPKPSEILELYVFLYSYLNSPPGYTLYGVEGKNGTVEKLKETIDPQGGCIAENEGEKVNIVEILCNPGLSQFNMGFRYGCQTLDYK